MNDQPKTPPATRVEVDLNIRKHGNQARVGFEDADGPLQPGQVVEVYESESGLTGVGTVTAINTTQRLAWLAVYWPGLAEPDAPRPAATANPAQPEDDEPEDDEQVQCWHIEPGTPCDWNICRQPERLVAGDAGTDPATNPEPPVAALHLTYRLPRGI